MTVHINPLLFEEEHLVRQVENDKEIWFVGADVCKVLGLANPRSSLALLDEDEKGVHTMDTLGGEQSVTIVSEAGVYRLVFKSRKPVAERFKRWLSHEVIPSIRKTGGYAAATAPQSVEPDDTQSNEGVKLRHVTECRLTFGNKAAAQMWFHLGLPVVPEMLVDPRQLSIFDYQSIKSVEPGA